MSRNYLIGVGGSGSKCVEAALHLCAAGLGPTSSSDLWLGMVDADEDNGNVDRTTRVLGLYKELREMLAGPKPSGLLKHNVLTAAGQPTWSPVPKGKHNLFDVFEHNLMQPDTALLMDCLYTTQSEQKLVLHGGFRGRPSIGAAVVLAQTLNASPFWKDIQDAIVAAGEGEEVRLFLVGSVFGGTGAAALPSLTRKLRQLVKQSRLTNRVKIGAALMLPYFRFSPPSDPGAFAARSDAFLMQAQGALRYYHALFRDDPIFDSFFVIGWPELAALPTTAPDSLDQCNPPLLPEMLASLAALRFFSWEEWPSDRLFHLGLPEDGVIGWEDIPAIAEDGKIGDRLGQLVRWAVAFHFVYAPCLGPKANFRNHPFFYRLVGGNYEQSFVSKLDAYAEHILRWVATLSLPTGDICKETRLFDIDLFANRLSMRKKEGMVELLPHLGHATGKRFGNLVHRYSGADLPTILERLSFLDAGGQGLNVFAHALFQECSVLNFTPAAHGGLMPA